MSIKTSCLIVRAIIKLGSISKQDYTSNTPNFCVWTCVTLEV